MLKNLEHFVQVLKIEKNHSSNTTVSYLSDLKSFEKYLLKRKIAFKQVVNKSEVVKQYFRYLSRSKISPSSIKRKFSSLSSYFSYLIDRKIIKRNPLNGVYTPKLAKKLPTVLSVEEIKKIFNQSENTDNELLGLRDRCIIELLYSCGLRVSELCELKINNIQFDSNVIRFFGKGNKERIIPLTFYAKEWMEKYLYQSRQILSNRKSSEQKYVFLSNNGKRLTRAAIWQSIKKYVNAAGITKTVSPHTFRHSFATHLVDGGANLIEIQKLLGHSDISTTEIYVHLSKEFVDSEYMKAFDKKKN
tara:strand:- start:1442 stop:2350 length:909 start_codon:yes stop_codon:yes gene_type:complete